MIQLSYARFLKRGLIDGGWDPKMNVTIADYFYGAAVQCLAQAYREWRTTQQHLSSLSREQFSVINRMHAAGNDTATIAKAAGLAPVVVSRVIRKDLVPGFEVQPDETWNEHPDTDIAVDQKVEETQQFVYMLDSIPLKYREVALLLMYWYSTRQIALKLRMTKSSVDRYKGKIRESLQLAGYAADLKDGEES